MVNLGEGGGEGGRGGCMPPNVRMYNKTIMLTCNLKCAREKVNGCVSDERQTKAAAVRAHAQTPMEELTALPHTP